MSEPSLVTEAFAAAAGAPTGFDPQTIMYVVGGIVSGIVVGIGGLLYRKSPNGVGPVPAAPPTPPVVDILGPYQQIFDRLGAIQLTLERVAGGHVETREATASALQQTRHDLKGVLQEMNKTFEGDIEELKRLMRDQNTVSDRLDEFVRARLK